MAAEVTPEAWAIALLTQMKKPVTYENVRAVTGWANAEGGHWHNQNKYNPLNVTTTTSHSTRASNNSTVFTSWKEGIEGTIKTLENGYYPEILAALSNGKNSAGVADAIEKSPWATSHYGGSLKATVAKTKVSQPHKKPNEIIPGEFSIPVIGGGLESVAGFLQGGGEEVGKAANKALAPLDIFGKLGESILHWVAEPLIPLKFVGGAVLLYIGVREVTTGTSAGRSASAGAGRTVAHAVELASVGGVAKRGAAKLSKPKAAK